jgi:hypothetical protein
VADALENRCLPCICSSNNEDSELEVAGELGKILLCGHSVEVCMTEDKLGALRRVRLIVRTY